MTNWYVITGGPSSGKTTTVDLLRARGYRTAIEDARLYIDLQRLGGRTVEEIRGRQVEFQRNVLAMQLAQEASLDRDELVFLDRAVPDSLVYYRFLGIEPDAALLDAIVRSRYRKVFVMDLLPLACVAVAAGWTVPRLRDHLARRCDPERVFDVAAVYRKHLARTVDESFARFLPV